MKLLGALLSQSGRPRGWLGRLLVRVMNRGHVGLTRWGLSKVEIADHMNVLDIGCGGGQTLEYLASLAGLGKTVGIDHSGDALVVASRRNRKLIASGRVEVLHESVSSMPFPDAEFDCVTAIESYYFWPDIRADLVEVRRVMKPNGRLVIIASMCLGAKFDQRNRKVAEAGGMRCFSAQEFEDRLLDAGFSRVTTTVEPRKGWICAIAELGPDERTK